MTKQETIAKFQREHDLSSWVEMQTIAECCLDAIYRLNLVTPLQEIERLAKQLIDATVYGGHSEKAGA